MFVPVLIAGALGAVLASFAGVISERLSTGESWLSGHSRCNACDRRLRAFDMVPVLSWLATLGRCRTCHASVPYRYALSEALLAFVYAYSVATLPWDLALLILLAFLFLLLVIVLYDLRHTIVPMTLSLPLVALSVIYAALSIPNAHALGAAFLIAGSIGSGFLLLHACSGGRAMGLGDAPIALALSLIAGGQAIAGLLFSFWIGAVVGILILVAAPRGHRMGIEVPFVPFLAFGYLLALYTQWNPLLF